ncbi:hypothetical protein JCM6882_009658 [Rhodosporidiobolus microsporus]
MDDLFGNDAPQQSDPAQDFLKREQEALGPDAGSFTAPSDAAGFDKDYEQSAAAFPDLDGGDDALGGLGGAPAAAGAGAGAVGQQVSVTGDNEFAAFENDYPEIEVPSEQPQTNGGGFAPTPSPIGLNAPAFSQAPPSFSSTPAPQEEGESEFIKSWRTKQAEEIARREEAAASKKEETIAKARNAIDNFYKEYNERKEKDIAKNKEDEEKFKSQLSDSLAQGTTWERICTLVDLQDSRSKTTTKSKQDLARFKEVLLSLKREGENAPVSSSIRRFAFPVVFFVAGGLAAAQIGLAGYQVYATKDSDDQEYRNRLIFMLFVACWTFLFSALHVLVNLHVGAACSFLTFLFWPLATALWSEVQDTSLASCKGTAFTSTCRQQLAIEAIGWTEVGATALLFFLVALHYRWQYQAGCSMRDVGRSGYYRF